MMPNDYLESERNNTCMAATVMTFVTENTDYAYGGAGNDYVIGGTVQIICTKTV